MQDEWELFVYDDSTEDYRDLKGNKIDKDDIEKFIGERTIEEYDKDCQRFAGYVYLLTEINKLYEELSIKFGSNMSEVKEKRSENDKEYTIPDQKLRH